MIGKVRAFGAFWYDFIVGDDWLVALGVVLAFAITYSASRFTDAPVWCIVVVAVVILLPLSVVVGRLTILVCSQLGAAVSEQRTAVLQARPELGVHTLQMGPVNLFGVGRHLNL